MQKVFVLTHTDSRERTRLLGVFTNEISTETLQSVCEKQDLNPLQCFWSAVTLDRVIPA